MDNEGKPIEGTLSVHFRIYDAEVEGTVLWEETQSVTLNNGLFNVLLGSTVPLTFSVFDSSAAYLSVQVGEDVELSPRKRLVSVDASTSCGR